MGVIGVGQKGLGRRLGGGAVTLGEDAFDGGDGVEDELNQGADDRKFGGGLGEGGEEVSHENYLSEVCLRATGRASRGCVSRPLVVIAWTCPVPEVISNTFKVQFPV